MQTSRTKGISLDSIEPNAAGIDVGALVALLHASFRPDSVICAVGAVSRHRASLVENAAAHVQHMHKELTQMNLQIHHLLSDLTGQSGMAIVDAIVSGERDPARLASLCHSGVRSERETVIKSLEGNYRPEHLFTLTQSLAAYRHYQQLVAECDREMERLVGQVGSKIDPAQKPLAPRPGTQKRRNNQFHFNIRTELYRIVYHLLTTRTLYNETAFAKEDQRQAIRHENRLRKQAKSLGFQLIPVTA